MNTSPVALIIAFISYLFLACLNVYLAREKGRKEVLWVFITFFLGFFATIMLLLADNVDQQPTGDMEAKKYTAG